MCYEFKIEFNNKLKYKSFATHVRNKLKKKDFKKLIFICHLDTSNACIYALIIINFSEFI